MADSERTEIIRKKKITVPAYAGEADNMIANEPDLMVGKTAMIKAALQRIADEFKDLTDYHIEDVDVSFTLSKSNLKESLSKDADAVQIAKLMPVMKMAVEKAVGIESHDNRYFFDNNIVRFDNLIGGYVEGDLLIPIRFGLKHSIAGKATLYVVVDQDGVPIKKTKAEVVKTPATNGMQPKASRSAFNINISDIIPYVNKKDLLRYIPDVSSARPDGSMEVVKLFWWKHNCKEGQYSSTKVHRSVKVALKDANSIPGSVDDYTISLEPLPGLEPEMIDGV